MPRLSKLIEKIEDRLANKWGCWYERNKARVPLYAVLGGIGSIRGSIIAATLLTILPEVLRAFSDYRMLVYAVVLILVMLATNNPQVRQFILKIRVAIAGRGKEAQDHV